MPARTVLDHAFRYGMASAVFPRDLKMFSFLRAGTTLMQNARIMRMRSTMQRSIQVCSFCNFYHFHLPNPMKYPFRHYATDTLEIHTTLKKKVKRRSRKYAKLPEAAGQIMNNGKAAVQDLNSAHVSTLVNQPGITLDELHKISSPSSSKKKRTTKVIDAETMTAVNSLHATNKMDNVHYTILEESGEYLKDKSMIVEELKESGISDHVTIIKDSSFLDTLHQIDKHGDKDERSDDSEEIIQTSKCGEFLNNTVAIPFVKEKDQFEDSLSDQNLVSQLLAYMDIYVHSGMSNKAFKLLMLNRNQLKHSKVSTIALYNLLIEAYACSADLGKIFEIYKMINVDFVKPNPQTYVLIFETIANMKSKKKQTESATEVATDMNHKGISFDEVMSTSTMNAVQRDTVLRCIRLLDPEYRVRYKMHIDTAYNCKLLQNLTEDSHYQSPAKGVLTVNKLQEMVHTQLNMEKQYELEVKSIAPFTGDPDLRQQAIDRIAEWEKSWVSSVTDAFEKNLFYLKQKETRLQPDLKALNPFLQVLPREEYVSAVIREIRQLAKSSDAYSTSLPYLYLSLGKYIYKKYEFRRKRKAGVIEGITQVYEKYLEWYLQKDPTNTSVNGRMKWEQLAQEANKSGICSDITVPEWPHNILLNVGKFLYNIIINNTNIPHGTKLNAFEREIPTFYLVFRNKTKFLTEEIKPHPHLHRLFKDSYPDMLTFETTLLPTCAPPRPWVDINVGGFLFSKTDFVRAPHTLGVNSMQSLKNTPTKQLYPALDCLNQLGSIPWRINQPMLDILIKIFREGGSEELNVPQPPSTLPSVSQLILNDPEKDRSKLSRLTLQLRRRKNEMYSLWCDCLYKLSLANQFRDKVFWLPHNLDFRGRAYPVPPHLNHLSSDLGRSILIFAQGKPLGPDGLDWLKIHTINLTGMKKREPIPKRLEFANEILDLIIDSARKPLTGEMWWTKSDEPWQTLAACKEIDNALQSPNVEEYISRFPIHQDGSCNGLQHYAALGKDQIGAESVNLYPSSAPQDVYSVVATMVDEYRKNDAAAGNEIAKALEGHISRKVIKQTVMTTVYGVTKFGARLQITRQLSDLKDFPQDYIWSGSLYLVEMTFKSLRTMFASAKEIQDWFTECARVISTRCNQYVQWVTPLGLPVIQPYCKRKSSGQGSKFLKKPDTLKQRNAFPPNFIHSLDSCHMMLTSLHCEQAGITFMSVHDCFWTHPCSVDIMSRICREQFVALHCEPILEDLSEFLCNRYKRNVVGDWQMKRRDEDLSLEVFKKLPRKGDFDINGVLSSQYFFS